MKKQTLFENEVIEDLPVLPVENIPHSHDGFGSEGLLEGTSLIGANIQSSYSGARALFFPDINTGFQVIDDAENNVFKAIVGGADIGDVIMGNYDGKAGIKYDKSTGELKMITSGANAFIVEYGSDILLKHGGDIKFTSVTAPTACTATLIETAGNVDAGTHKYKVTYVNETGETELGAISNEITADATHRQVALSNIPISPSGSVTKRKIYRTKAGRTEYYLLTTINDNTTTTYTDNTADTDLTGEKANYMGNNSFGKLFVDNVSSLELSNRNCFIGQNSGVNNHVGYYNVAIGINTLCDNIATGNTAIGHSSLYQNTLGGGNIGVGYSTLYHNTLGDNNIGIGYSSLYQNTTGGGNIGIGGSSLYYNTSGETNTAVGYVSLYHNQTGSGNIGLGTLAGAYETGSNAFYVNNQDRTNTAGDKAKSLLYGTMAAFPADQRLHVNADLLINSDCSLGLTGSRISKGWFTDLEVTNAIIGDITGRAGTVATITGLAPDTATTQATQGAITSLGTLTGLTMGGNIVAGDHSITGIDALTFTDISGTIAGIANEHLLDKNATETIIGNYSFSNSIILSANNKGIITNTSDGNDNFALYFHSTGYPNGFNYNRGATIGVYGNEHVSKPGNVLIGTGNVTGNKIEFITGSGISALIVNASQQFCIAQGIGIGNTTYTANSYLDDATHGDGSNTMYIGNSTVDVTPPSDRRTKKNIVDTKYSLNDLMKINVVDFKYKKKFEKEDIQHSGMIAQDLEKIYPEAVYERTDGMKAINYKILVPLLIQSIKELKLLKCL